MKFGHKLLLGTILLGGLVGVYFLDESKTEKKEQLTQEKSVALYFNNNDCTKFSMKNINGNFVFERKDFESPWYMISPKNVMADQDTINSLLVLLRNISVQREFETANDLDAFGLGHPNLTLSVTLENNTQKTVSFGKNLDMNPDSTIKLPSAYAQTTGRGSILVVDNSSLSSFSDKKYEDLRTKQVGYFKSADVSNITIQSNEETIELTLNQDHKWLITTPQTFDVDQDFIAVYLQTFRELFVDNIVESPDNRFFSLHNITLDQPTAQISFFDSNKKSLQNIPIYLSKNGLWIKMDDGSFGQLTLDKWTTFVPALKSFRNLELMHNTQAKCEKNFNDLIADDIIDQTSEEDLQKFGLQEPRKTFICHLDDNGEQTASNTLTISVGNHVPLNEKNVYVKRSDSDSVYIVSHEALSALAQ